MSTSYLVLQFEGTVEQLLAAGARDGLPVLGDLNSVRRAIDASLPMSEWCEREGELRACARFDDAWLEISFRSGEPIRTISIVARGADRCRPVAALCRRNGWRALDVNEGRFVDLHGIDFLNIDLDLESARDLAALVAALERAGLRTLYVATGAAGSSLATLQPSGLSDEPESSLTAILTAVGSLSAADRAAWDGCTRREVNVGYRCGTEPPELCHRLSGRSVERLAAAGLSMAITLYAPDAPRRRLGLQ